MKNEIDYLRIAMDESDGMFAWHFFGVVGATHASDWNHTCPNPQNEASEYLATFHADALAEAEKNSEKTLDATL